MSEPLILGWGLRDILLLAAALAGVYFILQWLRLLQLRRKTRPAPAPAPVRQAEPTLPAAAFTSPVSPLLTPREPRQRPQADAFDAYVSPPSPQPAPQMAMPRFDEALSQVSMEGRFNALTRELNQLREEVSRLQVEVQKLDAARNVSPLYGEAVSLSQQGMDAATIAVRCGISVAEAELVTSLSGKLQEMTAAGGDHFRDEDAL